MKKNEVKGQLIDIAVKADSRQPMVRMDSVQVSPEAGIQGDYRGRAHNRQITVISQESWGSTCRDLAHDLPWTTRRANLLVSGVDLQDKAGYLLQIGDVVLEITGETKPCERMDEAFPGLRETLEPGWRGGVTCQVLRGGSISPGVPVEVVRGIH